MGLTLVIADDAPFIREALVSIVERVGHKVIAEVDNGSLAVEMVLKLRPDLVIMDLVMPVKNGIQATREILEKNSSIKIVACSTLSDKNMMIQAIEAGCRGYIVKPFVVDDVIRVLNEVGGK